MVDSDAATTPDVGPGPDIAEPDVPDPADALVGLRIEPPEWNLALDLGAPERQTFTLIAQYAESHRDPTNVLIHWICVPIIVWCTLALAYVIHPWLAAAFAVGSLIYYLLLSVPMAIVMAAFAGASLWSLQVVPYPGWIALALFVITWIFQFIGHKIEGKKPSFLDDLRFLLVGPLFLLAKAFRRAGIRY